jgi:uncharacterized 2Fe-2S/4Fe-4S cluster protein (DUF4445 family)
MLIKVDNKHIEVNGAGKNLGSVLIDAGIPIDMRCSGKGICDKCKVILIKGLFKVSGEVKSVTEPLEVKSCLTEAVDENTEVFVPVKSLAKGKLQCAEAFHLKDFALDPEISGIAAVIDIGTTTVAASLINTDTGELLGTVSDYNHQFKYGDNVISRITFSEEETDNLYLLQDAIISDTINPLLIELYTENNLDSNVIRQVSVAGNTVMTLLFYGYSPASIGVMPFEPLMKEFPVKNASDFELKVAGDAPVRAVPAVSGYIGGDITAGVITSGMLDDPGMAVLIDVGTNCETVLKRGDRIYSCASAAGPAFEGAGVSCGCRAAAGAIERISINKNLDFELKTIGNTLPTGICGSAMVDFIAEARNAGLLNEFGRLDTEILNRAGRLLKLENNVIGCLISNDIYISEKDIEQILKAKAAVYAGLKTLCQAENCELAEIDRIYLAGGFAKYINVENAVNIGMLPRIPLERYEKIGNSSLAGAALNVLDRSADDKFLKESRMIEDIVLNTVPEFEFNYIDALLLP